MELRYYQTAIGERPFVDWLGSLNDRQAQRDINRAKDYFEDYKARTAQRRPRGRP